MHRLILAFSLLCGLAACTGEPPVDPEVAKSLQVQNVTVQVADVSTMPYLLLERLDLSEAQVEADIAGALRSELVQRPSPGKRAVIVDFRIVSIALHSTQTGMSRVFPFSQISGVMQIRDAATNEVLVAGRSISGNDNVGKYTLSSSSGAILSNGKSTRQAYDDVVAGFAVDVKRAIFEFEGPMSLVH